MAGTLRLVKYLDVEFPPFPTPRVFILTVLICTKRIMYDVFQRIKAMASQVANHKPIHSLIVYGMVYCTDHKQPTHINIGSPCWWCGNTNDFCNCLNIPCGAISRNYSFHATWHILKPSWTKPSTQYSSTTAQTLDHRHQPQKRSCHHNLQHPRAMASNHL